MNDIKKSEFIIKEFDDDTYMGYTISKSLMNIDDYVGSNTEVNISDLKDFSDKKFLLRKEALIKEFLK